MTASRESTTAESAQISARLSRWLQRFWPNRLDALIFLFAFLWVVALLDPLITVLLSKYDTVFPKREFILTAIGGCLAGLAFAAGRSRLNKKTGFAVLLACAFSFVLLVFSESQVLLGAAMSEANDRFRWQETGLGYWFKYAGIYVVGFLAIWLVTLAISKLWGYIAFKTNADKKVSRQRLLVVFAVVLFIAQLIQRIFFSGELSGAFWPNIFGVGLALVCVVVAGNFLTDNYWKMRWKLVLIALLLGSSCFFVLYGNAFIAYEPSLIWMAFCFEFGFLWTLLIANPGSVDSEGSGSSARAKGPGFWSLVAVGVVACAAYTVFAFDAFVLRASELQDWQFARAVKSVRRESDQQIRLDQIRFSPATPSFVTCRFRDGARVDVMECLEGKSFAFLTISGLTPEIDTRPIRGTGAGVELNDSRVTSSQLNDLVEGTAWGVSLTNVEVVDFNESLNLSTCPSVSILSKRPGQIASFLKTIGPTGTLSHIVVQADGPCSIDDIESMVEFSNSRLPIVIGRGLVDSLNLASIDKSLPMQNLIFDFHRFSDPLSETNRNENMPAIQFALQNDIFVIMPVNNPNQLFWDLVFAKNVQAFGGFERLAAWEQEYLGDGNDLLKNAERFHWSFGQDNTGQVTGLFLPCGESYLENFHPAERASLKSVEVLGFDPLWLNRVDPKSAWLKSVGQWGAIQEIKGQAFSAMPNLRRLDLSPLALVTNANILNLIPKIEHLQIRLDESIKSAVDFSVCTNLKSLVYFGTPSRSTMKELAGLNQLESVIVIDQGDAELFQATAVKNLENSIPGVKVQVIAESDFLPDPPAMFKQHLRQKSVELREKLLKTAPDASSFDEAGSPIDNSGNE